MPSAECDSIQAKASRYFPLWDRGELPKAPEFGWRHWTALIGPALLMAPTFGLSISCSEVGAQ